MYPQGAPKVAHQKPNYRSAINFFWIEEEKIIVNFFKLILFHDMRRQIETGRNITETVSEAQSFIN